MTPAVIVPPSVLVEVMRRALDAGVGPDEPLRIEQAAGATRLDVYRGERGLVRVATFTRDLTGTSWTEVK